MNKLELKPHHIFYSNKKDAFIIHHENSPFEKGDDDTLSFLSSYLKLIQEFVAPQTEWAIADSSSKQPTGALIFSIQKQPKGTDSTITFEQTLKGIPVYGKYITIFTSPQNKSIVGCQVNIAPNIYQIEIQTKSEESMNDFKQIATLLEDNWRDAEIMELKRWFYEVTPEDVKANQVASKKDSSYNKEEIIHPLFNDERWLKQMNTSINAGLYFCQQVFITAKDETGESFGWKSMLSLETGNMFRLQPLFIGAQRVNSKAFKNDLETTGLAQSMRLDSPDDLLEQNCIPCDFLIDEPTNGKLKLKGPYVWIADFEAPRKTPPDFSFPLIPSEFLPRVSSDNFSSINAYYHVDNCFRMMEKFGFDIKEYFSATTRNEGFPVLVDAFGFNSMINAAAISPDDLKSGISMFTFGKMATNSNLSMGCWRRVVLHEFSHAVLYECGEGDGTLGKISHSFGDGLGAIISDPESKAADKGIGIMFSDGDTRRIDRKLSEGWSFLGKRRKLLGNVGGPGGQNAYRNDYESEEVLGTTNFRIYKSIGGGSSTLSHRTYASDHVAYLLFKSAKFLPSTELVLPETYVSLLRYADAFAWNYHNYPGGVYGKVIRWAYEKQGAFLPIDINDPLIDLDDNYPSYIKQAGNPPDVDVYVKDKRNGEYDYIDPFQKESEIIVSKDTPDHPIKSIQIPAGTPAPELKVYINFDNRGLRNASEVKLKVYVFADSNQQDVSEEIFPSPKWKLITPSSVSYSATTKSFTVGPIPFTPGSIHNHIVVVTDAPEDNNVLFQNYQYLLRQLLCADNNMGYGYFLVEIKKKDETNDAPHTSSPISDGPVREGFIAKILNAIKRILKAINIFRILKKVNVPKPPKKA